MINVETLEEGDVVYAVNALYNDGGLEGVAENALLYPADNCYLQSACLGVRIAKKQGVNHAHLPKKPAHPSCHPVGRRCFVVLPDARHRTLKRAVKCKIYGE